MEKIEMLLHQFIQLINKLKCKLDNNPQKYQL